MQSLEVTGTQISELECELEISKTQGVAGKKGTGGQEEKVSEQMRASSNGGGCLFVFEHETLGEGVKGTKQKTMVLNESPFSIIPCPGEGAKMHLEGV